MKTKERSTSTIQSYRNKSNAWCLICCWRNSTNLLRPTTACRSPLAEFAVLTHYDTQHGMTADMNRITLSFAISVCGLLAMGGCIHQSTDGPTQTFTYAVWVPVTLLIGGIITMAAGWSIRKRCPNLRWALLLAGCIATVVAPSQFTDRAVVDHAALWTEGCAQRSV